MRCSHSWHNPSLNKETVLSAAFPLNNQCFTHLYPFVQRNFFMCYLSVTSMVGGYHCMYHLFSHWKIQFNFTTPHTAAPCHFVSPTPLPVLTSLGCRRLVLFALLIMDNAVSVCMILNTLSILFTNMFSLSVVLHYLQISLAGSVIAAFLPWIPVSTSDQPLQFPVVLVTALSLMFRIPVVSL